MTTSESGSALDAIDRRILDALQDDCAQTNQELAERVQTSPATCLRRVRRLVDGGVIERRIAILAPDVLKAGAWGGVAVGITAIVEVTLDRQSTESLAAFEERATADPAVQQCYRVASGPDFVLIVYVADTDAYQALARRLFTAAADVRNVKAYFSVRRAKFSPRIPLDGPSSG